MRTNNCGAGNIHIAFQTTFVWQYGQSPLHLAAKGGHEAIVELLLSYGVDVNAVDKVISYYVPCNYLSRSYTIYLHD